MEVQTMTEELFLEHFALLRGMILDYDSKAKSGIELSELLERMLDSAKQGTAMLIFDDEKIIGFILGELVKFDRASALDIVAVFISPTHNGNDAWEKGWEAIREVAVDFSCEKIICESRVGRKWQAYYERKLKKLGFKPVYMRYSMEV